MGRDRHQYRKPVGRGGDDCRAAFLGHFEELGQPVARFFRTFAPHGLDPPRGHPV